MLKTSATPFPWCEKMVEKIFKRILTSTQFISKHSLKLFNIYSDINPTLKILISFPWILIPLIFIPRSASTLILFPKKIILLSFFPKILLLNILSL